MVQVKWKGVRELVTNGYVEWHHFHSLWMTCKPDFKEHHSVFNISETVQDRDTVTMEDK